MLKLDRISKVYRTSEVETHALNDVSLEISPGEFVAIMGPSGCGKSTLLNILGLLDTPSAGTYSFFDETVSSYAEAQLTELRRAATGFIFQSFNLIDDLSVQENVEVALLYRGVPAKERHARVAEALERVGIAHRARHLPQQLSGGQQQRVAVARAVAARPIIVLPDEPTANLDSKAGAALLDLMRRLNEENGITFVFSTLDPLVVERARRVIRLRVGAIGAGERRGS